MEMHVASVERRARAVNVQRSIRVSGTCVCQGSLKTTVISTWIGRSVAGAPSAGVTL
jgi:hypothetical protein